jgi:hypothetical protein
MPALRAEGFPPRAQPHHQQRACNTAPASSPQQRVISGSSWTEPRSQSAPTEPPDRTLTAPPGGRVAPCTADQEQRQKLPPAGLACDAAGAQGVERPLHSLAEHGGVPGRQGRGRCAVAQARALTPFHLNGKPEAGRRHEAAQEAADGPFGGNPMGWPTLTPEMRPGGRRGRFWQPHLSNPWPGFGGPSGATLQPGAGDRSSGVSNNHHNNHNNNKIIILLML